MVLLVGVVLLGPTHMPSGPCGAMLLTNLGCPTIQSEAPGTREGTRRLLCADPKNSRQGMGASPGLGEQTDAMVRDLLAYEPDRSDNLRAGAAIA